MKLKHYIESQKTTVAAWAAVHGHPRSTVSRHVNGQRVPNPDEMTFYYLATHGAVQPNDFYDLPSLAEEAAHG